jgi:hypothetical protein
MLASSPHKVSDKSQSTSGSIVTGPSRVIFPESSSQVPRFGFKRNANGVSRLRCRFSHRNRRVDGDGHIKTNVSGIVVASADVKSRADSGAVLSLSERDVRRNVHRTSRAMFPESSSQVSMLSVEATQVVSCGFGAARVW